LWKRIGESELGPKKGTCTGEKGTLPQAKEGLTFRLLNRERREECVNQEDKSCEKKKGGPSVPKGDSFKKKRGRGEVAGHCSNWKKWRGITSRGRKKGAVSRRREGGAYGRGNGLLLSIYHGERKVLEVGGHPHMERKGGPFLGKKTIQN